MLSVDGDPHFIIQVPQRVDAICFNVDEDPGTVLRLIQDPITGGGCGQEPGPGPHSAHNALSLCAAYTLWGHRLTKPP